MRGTCDAVEIFDMGDSLDADAPAGATELQVPDATIWPASGWLRVGTHETSYVEIELEDDEDDVAEIVGPVGSTLILTDPLPEAAVAGDRVDLLVDAAGDQGRAVAQSATIWVTWGDDGEPQPFPVDHGLVPYAGDDKAGTEVVLAEVDGVTTVVEFVRRPSRFNGGAIDPGSLPVDTIGPPIDPPVATPAIEVEPMATGLYVRAGAFAAGTVLRYEVATEPTFAEIVWTTETANTPIVVGPLAAAVDYWIRVTAFNARGEATAVIVGPHRTRLIGDDDIVDLAVDKLRSGNLDAAVALFGQMSVGPTIRISPDTGIYVELPNGRRIVLGAPGEEARVEAVLTTWGFTSEGNAQLLGGNNWLRGTLTVSGGVTAPTIGPIANVTWPTSKRLPLEGAGATHRGIWWDGALWVSAIPTPYFTYVTRWDATGALIDTHLLTDIAPHGYARIGDVHYVLGTSGTDGWVVHAYNLAWVRTQRAVIGNLDRIPAITASESSVHVVYANGGTLRRRVYSTTLDLTGGPTDVDSTWGNVDVDGTVVSQADYGAWYILAVRGSTVRAYTLAGARSTPREFPRPNSEVIRGLTWTGSAVVALTDAGNVWTYAPVPVTVDRSLTSTKLDGDPSGGTHETTPSPARIVSQPARCWLMLQVDPVGDSGQPNDPDRPRFYVGNQLQTPDVAEGATTRLLGAPVASGITAPTSNGFAGIGGLNGALKSEATDGAGAIWSLGGDGTHRIEGVTFNATGLAIAGRYRKPHSITPTAANTPTTQRINFGFTFAQVPVIGIAKSSTDGRTVQVTYSAVTTTYVDIVVVRTNNATAVPFSLTAELPSA